jgi:hypothetical protein
MALSIVINTVTVGAANTPACQQEALPARYDTGATYPHTMKSFGVVPRRVLHRLNRCFEVLTLKLHVEVYGRLLGRSLKGVRTILLSVRVVRVL